MTQVVLGLGSNIDPVFNIRKAVAALESRYGELRLSPVYESRAIGFEGDNFLNLVVAMDVDTSLEQLAAELKQLEDGQGRDRAAARFSGRTLDIDILTFDQLQGTYAGIPLPRPEITEHAFVLKPLADLLADSIHPLTGKTYSRLWQEFDDSSQQLWQLDFDWDPAPDSSSHE